jgi:hypothetical protein
MPTAIRMLRGSDRVRSATPAGTPSAAPAMNGQIFACRAVSKVVVAFVQERLSVFRK